MRRCVRCSTRRWRRCAASSAGAFATSRASRTRGPMDWSTRHWTHAPAEPAAPSRSFLAPAVLPARMRSILTRAPRRATLTAALMSSVCAAVLAAPAADAAKKPTNVKVMTRNLYLGADLTAGVNASDLQGLVDAAGGILNTVDKNNFAVRAKGLSKEIRGHTPDLVGLQEVALWRTEPCTESPIPPKATTVRWDYLKLLLGQLNKGKKRYRAVVV